jgi:hypothetical protein
MKMKHDCCGQERNVVLARYNGKFIMLSLHVAYEGTKDAGLRTRLQTRWSTHCSMRLCYAGLLPMAAPLTTHRLPQQQTEA